MPQQHQLQQSLKSSIAVVHGIPTTCSFVPPSCVATGSPVPTTVPPFCVATGIPVVTTTPGYVPLQGVASADSRPTLQPPPLEELPDPQAIERQKHGYARSLDQQLEDGKRLIAEESIQQKEQLYQAAKQLKLEYSTRLELAVQKAELELDQFARQQQQMPILPHSSSVRLERTRRRLLRMDTMDGTVAAVGNLGAAPSRAATANQTACVELLARCMTSNASATAPNSPTLAGSWSMPFRTRQRRVGSPAPCLTRTISPAPIVVAVTSPASACPAWSLSQAAGSVHSSGMLRLSLAASHARCTATRVSTASRGPAAAVTSPLQCVSPSNMSRCQPVATSCGNKSSCGTAAIGPRSNNGPSLQSPSSTRLAPAPVRHSMPGGVLGAAR